MPDPLPISGKPTGAQHKKDGASKNIYSSVGKVIDTIDRLLKESENLARIGRKEESDVLLGVAKEQLAHIKDILVAIQSLDKRE